MRIRDALESDAEALASLTGRPVDVMRDAIHERSVRVAVREDGDGDDERTDAGTRDGSEERAGNGEEEPFGFVAFDVRSGTVHVTDFGGTIESVKRLFRAPLEFAAHEGMDVETVIDDGDVERIGVIRDVGFQSTGNGPRFEGRSTTRFHLNSSEIDGAND